MAYFDKIAIDGTAYDVRDTGARESLENLFQSLENLFQSFVTPEDYGAVGNGIADDSDALKQAILGAANSGKYLYFPSGKTYYIASLFSASSIAPVRILGANNSTLKFGSFLYGTPSPVPDQQFVSFINITAPSVFIEGLNFVGSAPAQWNVDIANMRFDNPIGIHGANDVHIYDSNFTNFWGTCVYITDSDHCNVDVGNCRFDNIGGHYHTINEYDMFGDPLDLDKITDCEVVIKSSSFIGRTNPGGINKGTDLSRCFLVPEFGNGRYHVTVDSCNITNFERVLHSEYVLDVQAVFNSCTISNFTLLVFNYSTSATSCNATFNSSNLYSAELPTWNSAATITCNNATLTTCAAHIKTNLIADAEKLTIISSQIYLDNPASTLNINKKQYGYVSAVNSQLSIPNGSVTGLSKGDGVGIYLFGGFVSAPNSAFNWAGAMVSGTNPFYGSTGWTNFTKTTYA